MADPVAEFETFKQELWARLADLERDFPYATNQLAAHRRAVDEFCNLESPTTSEARLERWRKQTNIKSAIMNSWLILNRMRLWSN